MARKHGLNTGQLYAWRRQFADAAVRAFGCVELVRDAAHGGAAVRLAGAIEIVLPDGTVVRIDAGTSEAARAAC